MEIRQRSYGENLNEWFRVLGRTWRPLLWPSLVAFAFVGAGVAVTMALTGAAETMLDLADPEYLETITESEAIDLFQSLAWVGGVWVILQWIATSFVLLTSTRAVNGEVAGMPQSTGAVSRFAIGRLGTVLGVGFIVMFAWILATGLVVFAIWTIFSVADAGFFTVFLAAVIVLTMLSVMIWIGVSISLYHQVVSAEETTAARALVRSYELVSGRWWITVGFVLVAGLIVSAVGQVISLVFTPLYVLAAFAPQLLTLTYGLALVFQGPVTAAIGAAYAIWYIDLRTRKEDLEANQLL